MREETRLLRVRSGGMRRSFDCAAIVGIDVEGRGAECGELQVMLRRAAVWYSSARLVWQYHVILRVVCLLRFWTRSLWHKVVVVVLCCGDDAAQSWLICCSCSPSACRVPQNVGFHMSLAGPLFTFALFSPLRCKSSHKKRKTH